jgi:hypothetical protein
MGGDPSRPNRNGILWVDLPPDISIAQVGKCSHDAVVPTVDRTRLGGSLEAVIYWRGTGSSNPVSSSSESSANLTSSWSFLERQRALDPRDGRSFAPPSLTGLSRRSVRRSGTESSQTLCWSKPDSNSRSHPDGELGSVQSCRCTGGLKHMLKVPRLSLLSSGSPAWPAIP